LRRSCCCGRSRRCGTCVTRPERRWQRDLEAVLGRPRKGAVIRMLKRRTLLVAVFAVFGVVLFWRRRGCHGCDPTAA
jgi:hypothetical protein